MGERCYCKRRVSFDIQCKYELVIDREYIMTKYHHLWLNDDKFDLLHPKFTKKGIFL